MKWTIALFSVLLLSSPCQDALAASPQHTRPNKKEEFRIVAPVAGQEVPLGERVTISLANVPHFDPPLPKGFCYPACGRPYFQFHLVDKKGQRHGIHNDMQCIASPHARFQKATALIKRDESGCTLLPGAYKLIVWNGSCGGPHFHAPGDCKEISSDWFQITQGKLKPAGVLCVKISYTKKPDKRDRELTAQASLTLCSPGVSRYGDVYLGFDENGFSRVNLEPGEYTFDALHGCCMSCTDPPEKIRIKSGETTRVVLTVWNG